VQLNQHAWVSDIGGGRVSLAQVTLEEDRVLVMKGGNGKRKREDEGCRYIRLERRARSRASSGCQRTRTWLTLLKSIVGSFVDQLSETNTDVEP
jgi:hypothetical protein